MRVTGILAVPRGGRRVVSIVLGAALVVGITIAAVPGSAPTQKHLATTATSGNSQSSSSKLNASDTSPQLPAPVAMSTYPVSSYKSAAAKLPTGMTSALQEDSGESGAQYLADSAAAIQAVKVVAALKKSGVHVLGSRIDGTKLTVNVASAGDVRAVSAAGATAVIGAPKKPDFSTTKFHTVDTTNTYGGEGYFYQQADQLGTADGFRCSIGFNGYSGSTGAAQFATAGHCETTIPSDQEAYSISQGAPQLRVGDSGLTIGDPLGGPVAGEFGSGMDYGLISSTDAGVDPHASLATWGGNNGTTPSTGAPTSSTPLSITGETQGIVGATMCKSGSTTGWTCGVIEAVDYGVQVYDDNGNPNTVNTIVATTCLLPGDSGGGAVIGTEAVAIDSGSQFPDTAASGNGYPCGNPGSDPQAAIKNGDPDDDPGYVSVFFPMESAAGDESVQGQEGSNWQLAVSVSTPVMTSPAPGAIATPAGGLSGTLANASSTSTVSLYLNNIPTAISTVSAASGTWNVSLAAVGAGTYSYSLVARSGFSVGTPTTGTIQIVVPVPVDLDGGVGDFNGDGNADVIARDASGNLWLYPGNGSNALESRVELDNASDGWGTATAIVPAGDFSGDGKPDVILRDASGNLWLFDGNGAHGFTARSEIATGWQGMTAIQNVGDFSGDGHDDIMARDSSGSLWLYPGNGAGGFEARVQIPGNWSGMSAIVGGGDFTGDGKTDVLMRDSSGTLWIYPNNGTDGFGARVSLGTGWNGLTIAAAGEFNGDYFADLLVRDSTGTLWLYPGNGANGFGTRIQLATGLGGYEIGGDGAAVVGTTATPSNLSVGIDFNEDGNRDLIARDSAGRLWLYEGNGAGGFSKQVELGSGFQGLSEITPVGDFNGDGNPDVIARDAAGNLWLYPGNGVNGFGPRIRIATGWQGMTALQSVGDVNGDGHIDLLARDSSGNIWLYPGNGVGGFSSRVLMATNWQAMTAIVGIGDFNGDGHPDVLARDSSGTLWLYPGNSSDGFGPRVSLGGGWSGYTLVGVGDFNGDGFPDLIARDPSGGLWLYEGNGTGGFLGHVFLGNSFANLTLAGDSTQ